jgi:hypothetical protein
VLQPGRDQRSGDGIHERAEITGARHPLAMVDERRAAPETADLLVDLGRGRRGIDAARNREAHAAQQRRVILRRLQQQRRQPLRAQCRHRRRGECLRLRHAASRLR